MEFRPSKGLRHFGHGLRRQRALRFGELVAEVFAEATGNRALASWLKLQTAHLALRRRDLAAARSDLALALELAIAIGRPALQFAGVSCFAEVLAAQGEAECARRVLAFAADHPSIGAAERDQIRARLAKLDAAQCFNSRARRTR